MKYKTLDRIKWLENTINTLQNFRNKGDFSTHKESEIIISICEYKEELEKLKKTL